MFGQWDKEQYFFTLPVCLSFYQAVLNSTIINQWRKKKTDINEKKCNNPILEIIDVDILYIILYLWMYINNTS